ncbi:tubulin-specific chaperone A [Neoconidiobolus thromboides FSU 785]|nr:tubulin-specific chaperone A [Neoconidiobolus thromboides FSU 785]
MSSLTELKIKTNIVKRLFKEEQYYLKEVDMLKAKFEAYKSSPEYDEYEAKQMRGAIEETEQLLPDCNKRLQAASNDLTELIKEKYNDPNPQNLEELNEATALIQSIIIN